MNIYDFDDTIMTGDSTFRFIAFCCLRNRRVALRVAGTGAAAVLFLMGRMEKTEFKQRIFGFLRELDDVGAWVERFWRRNEKYVKKWYLEKKRADDVIISASPEFLLRPMAERLGVRLIASRVDAKTGAFYGKNCHGEEKVRRFRDIYADASVDEFYSDSLSDAPMARLAREAFIVKGETILPWPGR